MSQIYVLVFAALLCVGIPVSANDEVCKEIREIFSHACSSNEDSSPLTVEKFTELIDEKVASRLDEIEEDVGKTKKKVDKLLDKFDQLLEKLTPTRTTDSPATTTDSLATTTDSYATGSGSMETTDSYATATDSLETTDSYATATDSLETTDSYATTTDSPITSTEPPTTTLPPYRPQNCSVVCSHVFSGALPNEPVGFATKGTPQRIFPDFSGDEGVLVYCECTEDEAWTVFQRRMDGSVDFYRNWFEYTNGFGDVSGEFWLGLEALNNFTEEGEYKLRIDLSDWDDKTAYAEYSKFAVGNASTNYELFVTSYAGNAGDSLLYHSGMMFSTAERDNDRENNMNCVEETKGPWWMNSCSRSNLNAEHFGSSYTPSQWRGILWYHWRSDYWYSLKGAEMKFRKN